MLFTISTPTEAKLTSLTPRAEHHGKDLVSAVTLGLSITGPNDFLETVRAGLLDAFYTVADDYTPGLPDIEPPRPKLRTKVLGSVPIVLPAIEGGTLYVEWGMGDDMALGNAKLDKFRVDLMEGGTCTVHFRVSTSDVSETESGRLFGKLGQVLHIRFEPPQPIAAESEGPTIDGTRGPGAAPLFEEPDEDEGPTPEQALVEAEAAAQSKRKGRRSAGAAA